MEISYHVESLYENRKVEKVQSRQMNYHVDGMCGNRKVEKVQSRQMYYHVDSLCGDNIVLCTVLYVHKYIIKVQSREMSYHVKSLYKNRQIEKVQSRQMYYHVDSLCGDNIVLCTVLYVHKYRMLTPTLTRFLYEMVYHLPMRIDKLYK